jgi:tetratricopeptide (TPR) repeat protein/ketosteroid isomerase-like protein
MSPEQVAGTPIDGRSDMFAVGAVMYELFTRRQAFPGAIDGGVLNKILNVEPEPLETLCPYLDPAIGQIVRRALQKNPDDRYPNLAQMRSEVARVRQVLEASVQEDAEATVAVLPVDQTVRVTPTPRRGPDRDEIARRRAQQIDEHLTAARTAIADNRWDESIARCEEALLLDPNETRALDLAEQARLKRDEASAREFVNQAREHLKSGNLTTASSCVREALALTPDSADAREMGRLVGEARQAQERERQRAAAVEQILARGRQALEQGNPQAAMAAADEALALAPGNEHANRLKEEGQQALERQQREAREAEARETVDEAHRLFAEGQHADALALLEQFWPAHALVSQAWTELSNEAARLESERLAETTFTAPAGDLAEDGKTVFIPRVQPSAYEAGEPPSGSAVHEDIEPAAQMPEQTILGPSFEQSGATVFAPPPEPPTVFAPPPESPTVFAPAPEPPTVFAPPPTPAPEAALPAPSVAPYGAPSQTRGQTNVPAPPPAEAKSTPAPSPSAERRPTTPVPVRVETKPARSRTWLYAAVAGAAVVLIAVVVLLLPKGTPGPGDGGSPGGAVTSIAANTSSVVPTPTTIPSPPPTISAPPPTVQPTTVPPTTVPVGRRGTGPVTAPPTAAPTALTTIPAPPTTVPRIDDQFGGRGVTVAPTSVLPVPTTPTTIPRDTIVVPPPSTAPATVAPAGPSDREAITNTLNAYASAYARRDVDAISRLHPTIDRARLTDGFKDMKSQSVDLRNVQISINGNTATVSCSVHTKAEFDSGKHQESTVRTEFQLQKQSGGNWLIVQRR